MGIQYSTFAIDETPFCIWKWDLKKHNIEFIDNINHEYFEYLSNINFQILKQKNDDKDGEFLKYDQYAAISLRNAYSHGLETLFALLCATLQAPDCIFGWLKKYKLHQVTSFINKIKYGQKILTKFRLEKITWFDISNLIFNYFALEDKQLEIRIKKNFGDLWMSFSNDFLNQKFREEYNSLKHGFRIKPGGLKLAFGLQNEPHVPAPPEKMQLLGGSEYGSSFYTEEKINKDKNNFQLIHFSRNWEPENFAHGLNLIAISIFNIQSFLKIINGVDPTKVQFKWLKDESLFEQPWKRYSGVNEISWDNSIKVEHIRCLKKEEILSVYKSNKR